MKVFISHKNTDTSLALTVQSEFKRLGIDAYLDVLDSSLIGDGEALTKHIKKKLNECTDIIVVMSDSTKKSWWVPFEIGMSAQIDMPTVTFLKDNVELPDYLSYWPRLRKLDDIIKYVLARRKTQADFNYKYSYFSNQSEAYRRSVETPMFYENLKKELR